MSSPKKHVCIIGGGSSGLIIMKELQALGHTFACFEMLPTLGGVYLKSYQNTTLTTSSLLTAWSDHSDGLEHNPRFWRAEEYIDYLHAFARKHDLERHIHFRTQVTLVRRCNTTQKWLVTVQGGLGCEDIPRCETLPFDESVEPFTLAFDAICIATGTNTFPSLPTFPGQEHFDGPILHSLDYRTPEAFKGQRVLVVGSGESGSDISNEISKYASKVAVVIRGKHGHLVPRIQGGGRVTDLNTTRSRHANPFVFGDWIAWVSMLCNRVLSSLGPQTEMSKVLRKINDMNMEQGTSSFSKFACKNEGFVAAMVLRGAELHRDRFVLRGNKAIFEDGSEFECDAIVACTGFKNAFPMFEQFHGDIVEAGRNPRSLYKQMFCVPFGGEIAFFGFARPAFGSIPATVEMQARLFALVMNGDVVLPSQEEMTRVALQDKLEWERRYGYDTKRVKGLVDLLMYCDGLAELIGCKSPLWQLFFSKPSLWYKILFGPFTMHQYRLRGPGADPERAEAVLMRTPSGDMLESAINFSFLITAKFFSLLGLKMFKPINF